MVLSRARKTLNQTAAKSNAKESMNNSSYHSLLFIVLSVPLMISTNSFSYLAKNPSTGRYDHSVPTVTLLAEVTKAVLSVLQLASIVGVTNVWAALREMPIRRVMLYLVPALCHCITNVSCSPPLVFL